MRRERRVSGARQGCGLGRSERGQDMVEFALVVPILLLLFLGIIEFGIIVFRYNSVSSLAREGARYGIVHTDASAIQAYTLAEAAGIGLNPPPTVVIDRTPGSGYVEVDVSYAHEPITGSFLDALFNIDPTVNLHSVARMRTEQ